MLENIRLTIPEHLQHFDWYAPHLLWVGSPTAVGAKRANLRHANLRSTNLSSANLRYADLRHANLSYADLSYADLSSANLRSADLRHANLRFLQSANGKELTCMNAGKYQVVLSKESIAIGCKLFTVEKWKEFNDATISMMDDGALELWIKWEDLVFMFHKNIFG